MARFRPPPPESNSQAKLQGYVKRLIELEDSRALTAEDIRDLKKEAKGEGFDVQAIMLAVKMHRKGLTGAIADRDDARDRVDIVLAAMGWLPGGVEALATVAEPETAGE